MILSLCRSIGSDSTRSNCRGIGLWLYVVEGMYLSLVMSFLCFVCIPPWWWVFYVFLDTSNLPTCWQYMLIFLDLSVVSHLCFIIYCRKLNIIEVWFIFLLFWKADMINCTFLYLSVGALNCLLEFLFYHLYSQVY